MVRRKRESSGDSDVEVLATYVPPGGRRSVARAPPRKRVAPRRRAIYDDDLEVDDPDLDRIKQKRREARQARLQLAKNSAKIIFGIDFGTTFSGIAYSVSDQLDHITTLMDLDDTDNDNPKVPSCVLFENSEVTWGGDAKDDPNSIEWFKLLLIDEGDLAEDVANSHHVLAARQCLLELGKTAEEVVGTYLKKLWTSCLAQVKIEQSEAAVALSRFRVVMTVPAIWPDYARKRMEEAVQYAGILNHRPGVADTVLTFVTEPEAATLATLKRSDGRCDIEDEDCFVICDAGGGTVDLVSYKVVSTEPMVVSEIVKGTGGLCGAVFVDDHFIVLLKQKFHEISPDAWDTLTTVEIKKIMSEEWTRMRKRFKGGCVEDYSFRVPGSLYQAGILGMAEEGNLINIKGSELKEVFEPTFEKILALVKDQIQSVETKEGGPPKYVVLVGGFGRNKYMYKYMYKYLKTELGDVEVLQSQGEEPWTAICRGAVIHGLTVEKVPSRFSVEVASRIARASYGVMCHEKWDTDKHLAEDRFFDEQQRAWKATNQIKWLIREGEDVMADKKIQYDFKRLVDVYQVPESIFTSVWMCHISPPPTRKDEYVFKHSSMEWAAKIHWGRLPRFVNNKDEEYHELDFKIEMVCSGGATDMSVLHKGARAAKSNLKVEYLDKANMGA